MKTTKITTIMLAVLVLFGTTTYVCRADDAAAAITSSPSTDAGQDGPATVTATPSNDANQDGGATITSSPSTEANQDNPVVPVSGGGGTITNNGGGSSTGSSGSSAIISSGSSSVLASTTCNYLTDYLKLGRNNNTAEVTKLQAFLKTVEGLNVDVNGSFDDKTFEAVKSFQEKYLSDVMAPWGVTTPTGQVWYTTKKKINEIYCKSIVNLTPAQLAEIEAYKNGLSLTATTTQEVGTTTPDVGALGDESQTAAAVNAPFFTKVWNFIKWLFGY